MRVILINTATASGLHKRFGEGFELQPIPVKYNNMWMIDVDTISRLKSEIVDKYGHNQNIMTKATAVWQQLKDKTIYNLNDYPQYQYVLSDLESQEATDYANRFNDLNPREDIS